MMKEEFVERLTSEAKERFNDDQYDLIQYVYTYHPAISSKDQIAAVYNLPCGMSLIRDMKATAEKAEAIEKKMQELRHQRDEAQRELNNLQAQLKAMAS